MIFSDKTLSQISKTLDEIHKYIVFNETSREQIPLMGMLSNDEYFGINMQGYYGPYQDLIRLIFSIENIGSKWSIEPIKEIIFKIISDLAINKKNSVVTDFQQVALSLIEKINIEFQEAEIFVPIIGLSIDRILEVGNVKFMPLNEKPDSFQGALTSHLDKLSDFRDCLASLKVKAEWHRSSEIAREEIEKSLNILRYIGSLIWWDRPIGHIYIKGKDISRVSYTIVVQPNTNKVLGTVGNTEFTPAPFKIDEEFMQFANFYDFNYIESLLNKTKSPLEEDLLAAIQWFGFASQETEQIVSFVKFYIAIETILKKEKENAKIVLPKRVSGLYEPLSERKKEKVREEFLELIDERNSVFHAGRPNKFTAEYLSSIGLIYARQIIDQVRQKIRKNDFQTKDQLITWIKND